MKIDLKKIKKIALLILFLFIGFELALLLWPRLDNTERIKIAREQCLAIVQAVEQFKIDCGRYPSTDEGISVLAHKPNLQGWQGPYLSGPMHQRGWLDPWGQPFKFVMTDQGVGIRSCGPDMILKSDDDIEVMHDLKVSGSRENLKADSQ